MAAAGVKDPLSGHPGHLSPEQQHKLDKFKEELAAEGLYDPAKFDDAYLLRFLRARKFDLPKAKLMWSDFIKWRNEFHVDELYQSFEYPELPQVNKYYPKFYHKTDKDGRPVYIEILGQIDVAKLATITTDQRQLQRLVVEYERFLRDRLPVCSEVAGHLIETSCTIMDLKGVGISQFWKVKGFVQAAAAVSSNNYPETMGKFYVINAPWAFTTVWSFVKSLLDEVTVSKIQILGSDYIKVLAQQIPLENIPARIGGKCNCPGGCDLSNAGPWQDEKLVQRVKDKREQAAQSAHAPEPAKEKETPAPAPAPAPAAAPAHAPEPVAAAAAAPAPVAAAAAAPQQHHSAPAEMHAARTQSAAPIVHHHEAHSVPSTAGVQMTVVESKVDS